MRERDSNHPLIEFAKMYRKTYTSRIRVFRVEDFDMSGQLFILKTRPPVLVRPGGWEGEPHKSKLIGFTGDDQELRFEQSLIEEPLIKRLLNRDDLRFLARFTIPEE